MERPTVLMPSVSAGINLKKAPKLRWCMLFNRQCLIIPQIFQILFFSMYVLIVWEFPIMHPFQSSQAHPPPQWCPHIKEAEEEEKANLCCPYTHCSMVKSLWSVSPSPPTILYGLPASPTATFSHYKTNNFAHKTCYSMCSLKSIISRDIQYIP